jgi:hypothetical protein
MQTKQLSQIWIYPIKSLGGISLFQSDVLPKGLQYDRRWMLVDEEGIFLTQRKLPRMALFKPTLAGDVLRVRFGDDQIEIPLHIESHDSIQTRVWDDLVQTLEADPRISEWFSAHLQLKCRLVFFPEGSARPVDPAYQRQGDHTSLSDGYPFLIIGQASLDLLNQKLAQPIPMTRFRPNFVFTGGVAHEEDDWNEFSIGSCRFAAVKPCARCAIPTIDQETAMMGKEPTRTLATYRTKNNKILFGNNLLLLSGTKVSVGDALALD